MQKNRHSLWMIVVSVCLMLISVTSTATAKVPPEWVAPHPPFKIAGNLYYVGGSDLASYLITTPQGHILINSNLEETVPQIRASVEKLGFKFSDIKILLISHAHRDHDSASQTIKRLTGAKYEVMAGDVDVVESGGRKDFAYGNDPHTYYAPAKVDRVLHDGDVVALGGTELVAHLTPGHTKGGTTWTMKVQEGGKTYNALIYSSTGINDDYNLVNSKAYPQMAADYKKSFRVLKSLPVDIFLGSHAGFFDLETKYPHYQKFGFQVFIDPKGYQKYVAEREGVFLKALKKQQGKGR